MKFKQTEIGEIPEGWSVVTLSDIAELLDYKRVPLNSRVRDSKKGIYPYYGASGIVDHLDDYIFDGEHVLISEDGENLRSRQTPIAFIAKDKFWVNNHAHIVLGKSDLMNQFIVYYFQNIDINPYITGAVQPKLNQDNLLKIPIYLPPDIERKGVVQILKAFDDKIELNHQMNKTLESIAQAIFKRWFVDFEFPGHEKTKVVDDLPEGWRQGALGEIVKIESGKRPGEKSETKTQDFAVSLIGASSVMGFVKDALYKEPILIIGRVGTHGVVQRVSWPSFPSDNTLIIRSKYFEFVYQVLKTIDYKALNVGTTQPLITQTSIKNYTILLPNVDVLNAFENSISGLFKKITANDRENESLIMIRDSLLPRLMSGKIRVVK